MTDEQRQCQLIAALDSNHNGDLGLAKALVEAAIKCGCDAVKVPRRHVRDCYQKDTYQAPYHVFPELGDTFGPVMESLELSQQDMAELRAYCRGRTDFIAAPYDLRSLGEIAELDPDGYQIDPPLVPHLSLLEGIAGENKPVLAALGMCYDGDIENLVEKLGSCDLTLLHCVAASPLDLEKTALSTIPYLRQRYGRTVGYLSTELESAGVLAALALGATVIQRPLTLERNGRGSNHQLRTDSEHWSEMATQLRALEVSLKPVQGRRVLDVEVDTLDSSRVSLVAARDLPAGTILRAEMVNVKAPHRGISPALLTRMVGKKLLYDLPADSPITFGLVEP